MQNNDMPNSTLLLKYNDLIALLKVNISELIRAKGVAPEGVFTSKFLDLREFNYRPNGYCVEYLNEDVFIDRVGQACDFSIVESDLPTLLTIIENVKAA